MKKPVLKDLFEYEDPDLLGTHESSHWYLKEGDPVLEDESEIAREDAAAKKLEQFMEKWLKENPHREGVHYSDLFEQYIYVVKEKPRRQLIDWLPDYFYKTLEGTYRLPASDEERSARRKPVVPARTAASNAMCLTWKTGCRCLRRRGLPTPP